MAAQLDPHEIPAGADVTVPNPVPPLPTVSAYADDEPAGWKLAVTDCAWFICTVQPPVPVHAPLHPVNTDPASGVASRLTETPAAK